MLGLQVTSILLLLEQQTASSIDSSSSSSSLEEQYGITSVGSHGIDGQWKSTTFGEQVTTMPPVSVVVDSCVLREATTNGATN
jgi:hypothetical protein